MIYVLINKTYEILDKIDSVTPGGAKQYFMKMKQMEDEEQFDKLWKVMTHKEYDTNQAAFQRSASSDTFNNRWWTEEAVGPDEGFDY
jgi:hypothetical protein|tara:strand:+ start:27707 stop:27967 length:261 start_codon:yes stop_codon:yes gene_type:complete